MALADALPMLRTSLAECLATSDVPAVTLVTCTGAWLPTVWDYAERLVVRAELRDAPPG